MAALEKRSRTDWQETRQRPLPASVSRTTRTCTKRSRVLSRVPTVAYIYDADGNKILDGMSGLWCVNAGYGRERLVEAAESQMRELPYYNSFFQCAHPPSIALAKKTAGSYTGHT